MTSLLCVTGRSAGVRYTLSELTVVGRASASAVQILDESVSRSHFAISKAGSGFMLEDLGGQNGTLLNGVRVREPQALKRGDVIAAGPATFVFDPALDYLSGSGEGTDVIIAEEPAPPSQIRTVAGDEGAGDDKDLLEIVARALTGKAGAKGADVLAAGLEVIAQRFGGERAFLLSELGGRRRVVASFGPGPITVSRTVVDRVLSQKQGVVSGDATQDVAFSGGVSLLSGEVRSLLAAPLVLDGKAVGMVHLDRTRKDAFGEPELARLIPAANVLALVLLVADGIDALKRRARTKNEVEAPAIVAESPAMKRVVAAAEKAAKSDATVLLTGETGTGKEVLARLIHARSARAEGPFVPVNCGALVEALQESELFGHEKGAFTGASAKKIGLFEAADGGTLFLDEVGECARATQVKLLRVLQERVVHRVGSTRGVLVNVRIVAATSRNLDDMVARGLLREDLYYRLKVVQLVTPTLRSRPEDIPPLVAHFAKTFARSVGVVERPVTPALVEALIRHGWPGNVRELSNVVERLVILAEGHQIDVADLPSDLLAGPSVARSAIRAGETLATAVAVVEREMILRAMARTGGVKSATADALGISRVTLDGKLRNHNIEWSRKSRSGES